MTPTKNTEYPGAESQSTDFDVIVVGGGLAGGLCVLALSHHAPHLRTALIEAEPEPAGNHTWCCHRDDIELASDNARSPWDWLSRLELIRWSDYDVRFPRYTRTLHAEYLCLRSPALIRALRHAGRADLAQGTNPRLEIWLGRRASALTHTTVTLESGHVLQARLVIDARGGVTDPNRGLTGRMGFQKFLGFEIEIAPGHPFARRPLLMDARVTQHDGYRFVYTLPFSPTRFLVEDTYFSRTPLFDESALAARLTEYLAAAGARDYTIVRQERGILPMPWAPLRRPGLSTSRRAPAANEPLRIGYRGDFFHPATGYSMGQAIVVADRLGRTLGACELRHLRTAAATTLAELQRLFLPSRRFAHLLNYAAFRLTPGAWLRDLVFTQVMQLPEPVLARFFAGCTTKRDRLVVLAATARLPGLVPSVRRAFPATGDLA